MRIAVQAGTETDTAATLYQHTTARQDEDVAPCLLPTFRAFTWREATGMMPAP